MQTFIIKEHRSEALTSSTFLKHTRQSLLFLGPNLIRFCYPFESMFHLVIVITEMLFYWTRMLFVACQDILLGFK